MIALYFIIAYIGMWYFIITHKDIIEVFSLVEKFVMLFIFTLAWPFMVVALIITFFYETVLDREL